MRTIKSALIAALLLGLVLSLPALAQITNFDNVVVTADVVVGDDLTVADDVAISGLVRHAAATAITVSNGSEVTPTGSYQPITSAANTGTSDITIQTAGTIVTFVNTANTTITFTDTGTLKLSGNAALGQYDTLTVISDGTNWIEVSETNN